MKHEKRNLRPDTLREKVRDLLEKQFLAVVENFEKLTPKEQISMWLKMAEYSIPKHRYIEQDIDKVLYRVDGLPELTIEANTEN